MRIVIEWSNNLDISRNIKDAADIIENMWDYDDIRHTSYDLTWLEASGVSWIKLSFCDPQVDEYIFTVYSEEPDD